MALDPDVMHCNRAAEGARALVTGADGFVGRVVCERLLAAGWSVTAAVRGTARPLACGAVRWAGGAIEDADWDAVLPGHDAVVHLAARVPEGRGRDDDAAFRRTNVEATARLAQAAARAGVRRMVLASTVKVHGEGDAAARLSEDSPIAPADPYARSKRDAEAALHQVAATTGLQAAVVRPCVVYGSGVRGNLLRLMASVDRGLPLPFAGLANRRSLVSVWSLADLFARCADDPRAAGATFVAADDPPLSTPELVRALAAALGVRPRLVRVPSLLWAIGARMPAAGGMVRRLAGSLEVDASLARARLGWQPAVTLDEGLARTVRWYRARSPGGVAAGVAESA